MSRCFDISLMPLPYQPWELAPAYGESTIAVHHSCILSAHVDALRILLCGHQSRGVRELSELMRIADAFGRDANEIRWHLGAIMAHELYFCSMRPRCGGAFEPRGSLGALVKRDFGSYSELCYRFRESAASLRGVGFLYLVLDSRRRLRLLVARDTEYPIGVRGEPLLCMDLWEHAYFADHGNDRASAVDAFLSVANWEHAEKRLARYTESQK